MQPKLDHAAADAAHAALLGALATRALRPAFDRDLGPYTSHPMDPRTPESVADAVSEDDAQSLAESELCTTTEPLADWLAKRCDCDQGRAPIDTSRLRDIDLIDSDRVPVLLAALFDGDDSLQRAAISRLRALYLKAERKTVGQRAAELLAQA